MQNLTEVVKSKEIFRKLCRDFIFAVNVRM